MFFKLSDGSRVEAKVTKRGEHRYAVAYTAAFPTSSGELSIFNGLFSQHLTLKAAEAACKRFLNDSPHVTAASVVEACSDLYEVEYRRALSLA